MRTGPAREKAEFPRIVRMGNPAEVRGAPMKTPRTLSIDLRRQVRRVSFGFEASPPLGEKRVQLFELYVYED